MSPDDQHARRLQDGITTRQTESRKSEAAVATTTSLLERRALVGKVLIITGGAVVATRRRSRRERDVCKRGSLPWAVPRVDPGAAVAVYRRPRNGARGISPTRVAAIALEAQRQMCSPE